MAKEEKKIKKILPIQEGYQPTHGNVDVSNPPRGGSGVPSSSSSSSSVSSKKKVVNVED